MNNLIKVNTNEKGEVVISGRELHEFLEIGTEYMKWFDRMTEYGFTENVDFSVIVNFDDDDTAFGGLRKITDHAIKLDMAKELAMIQRNDKGKQARLYFIAIEKEYNSPEKIMARALILIGDLAKILKQNGYDTGQKRLFETLRNKGFLIKNGSSKNMPTQKSMELKLFEVKETTINNPDGSIRVTKTVKVTGKGQQYFINLFNKIA